MNILIKPIITEKATADVEDFNRYGFVVNPKANKVEIKKAVEAAYDVSVTKVSTINVRPDRNTRFTKALPSGSPALADSPSGADSF